MNNLYIYLFIYFFNLCKLCYLTNEIEICLENSHCQFGFCNKKSFAGNEKCNYGRCGCLSNHYLDYNYNCIARKFLIIQKKNIGFNFYFMSFFIERKYGEDCKVNFQCMEADNLTCLNGKCLCRNNYYEYKNGKCVIKNPKAFGENCSIDESFCAEENTVCIKGECQCKMNYYRRYYKCKECK